jgi:hypothetical protein
VERGLHEQYFLMRYGGPRVNRSLDFRVIKVTGRPGNLKFGVQGNLIINRRYDRRAQRLLKQTTMNGMEFLLFPVVLTLIGW